MSWFKISSAIFAFSSFQFLILCQAPPAVGTPQPPAVESETGYLTASADIELPPESPKIFIAPQTTLPIMEDSLESYAFLVNVGSFATVKAKSHVLTAKGKGSMARRRDIPDKKQILSPAQEAFHAEQNPRQGCHESFRRGMFYVSTRKK